MKRKINEKDAPPGCRAVRATKAMKRECIGCESEHTLESCRFGMCIPANRKDGQLVVFKRVKQAKKAHVWIKMYEEQPNRWIPCYGWKKTKREVQADIEETKIRWPEQHYKYKKFMEVG